VLIERQVGHQLLELAVLLFNLAQAPQFDDPIPANCRFQR
jgi:hypothetical protein